MSIRSRTTQFIDYRESSHRRKQRFSIHYQDEDEVRLVGDGLGFQSSIEMRELKSSSNLPPEWIDKVEEVQYAISRIKQRVKELNQLHDKHLNRPAFDGGDDEEYAIEIMTQEITTMFQSAQKAIKSINLNENMINKASEKKMCINISLSLASQLQKISASFRNAQNTYLHRMKNREKRKSDNGYFDDNLFQDNTGGGCNNIVNTNNQLTETQLIQIEQDSERIQRRDQEIENIAKSITQLGEIFKELNAMIIDQGSIVDRIDFQLERTHEFIQEGTVELEKAHNYQSRSRKWKCILVLLLLIIMFSILIALR